MPFSVLQEELDNLREQNLYRSCSEVEEVRGGRIRVDGRWLIHMASNGYLGLHLHPRVIAAAKKGCDEFGAGSGSARLIGGTLSLHARLEEKLAAFKQAEAALVFPTGYMANLGIITALVGPGDLVIGDHLNHASLVDACRLSGASFRVYPHLDAERLGEALKSRIGRYRRVLVVTEGVFSMDGDIAPLPNIAEVARRTGAWLLVDDAHGTGVLGAAGRGSLEHFGISTEEILQMGTLSKALGSVGGFVAGPKVVIDYLKNKARSFIYTTASSPASLAAALEGLAVLEQEPSLRENLFRNVRIWVAGLREAGYRLMSAESQIVPVWTGDNNGTMRMARLLLEAGVYAPGIRPPTVPAGACRIRTSLTALHEEADIKVALDIFKKLSKDETIRVCLEKAPAAGSQNVGLPHT